MNLINTDSMIRNRLQEQVNTTLEKGSLISAILGLVSAALIYAMDVIGFTQNLNIPAIWAAACGIYSLLLHVLARKKLLNGGILYALTLGYISLPSVIYVIAHFSLDSGAATYITGPPSYLYFFLITMTGFLFRSKVSVVSGLVGGLEYLLMYLLDADHLNALHADDPLMLQDLTAFPIYFFKSIMMVSTGLVVGILSKHTKHLIVNILYEEQERQKIDSLFGQYVSSEVKEKLVASHLNESGEKKSVAILFADIRRFTEMTEHRDPKDVVTQLNEYLDHMVQCIASEGGVVDKFIGDAIMATFGGVLQLDNAPLAAVNSSLAMHRRLAELNQQWEDDGLPRFEIGIGIHYGEVLQGSVGSKIRKQYTVIGDTVNTASRIETLTKEHGYGILLSAEVADRLPWQKELTAADVGDVKVRGKSETLRIYGLLPVLHGRKSSS